MNNKYFLYVGNAYPHKNLERLVKAIVLLNSDSKEKIILKISCSRGIFTDRLEKIISKNNAKHLIQLLGYVSDADIPDLYKKSVAFVFPTLAEGFGLPPMEAIESEALAVVSDIPVLKEIYADSVIYFNPIDISSIAKVLSNTLTIKDDDRKKRIAYSQKFIKKYSWAKMANETLKVYESA